MSLTSGDVPVELRDRHSLAGSILHNHEGRDSRGENGSPTRDDQGVLLQQLRPADGGFSAWTVLMASFIFEGLFWGFPTAYGVFQNYYSTLPQFRQNTLQVALIGTLAQGIYYLGAPASAALTKRYPRYRHQQIWLGWSMCIFGLLAASFADTVAGLICTQGVLYGVGFVVFTYPIIGMIDEWWVARKGMAFGIISAASGATGAGMPFVLQALLSKYGYSTTLRACSVAMTILTAPLLPILKGRLPPSASAVLARTNWSFVKKPLFWIYSLSTLVQGLGFFFPPIYLPSYASVIGIDSTKGALLLAIMSVSQVLGQFAFGWLSDQKWSVSLLTAICSVVASTATFALWGVFRSLGLLVLFSILYGFFGFGFGTMRVAMGRAVSDDPSAAVTTYAVFVFLQGIGNVMVGPISAGLLSVGKDFDGYAAGGYSYLVVFTGSCLMLSALIICLWHSILLIPR